jgi:hypothetical protein
MIDIASSVLPFGDLETEEVYSYYDFPRFYALRSGLYPSIRFLVLCIRDDDESTDVEFLYRSMTADRLAVVRSGGVGLRQALTDTAAGGQLWRVRVSYETAEPTIEAEMIEPEGLLDTELPTERARLDYPTPTARTFDTDADVVLRSRELSRSVVAIELEASAERRTEFPLGWLGQVQVYIQSLLTAIGQEIDSKVTARGAVQKSVVQSMQMSAIPLTLAASYVFLITPDLDAAGQLFESHLVGDSLKELGDLLRACGTEDEQVLLEKFFAHGPRVRGRFRDLLDTVKGASSSIGLVASGPTLEGVLSAQVSRRQVRAALDAVESAEPNQDVIDVRRGCLVGLDTNTGQFHLVDMATGADYKGGSTSEVRSQWAPTVEVGQGSFVSARIEVEKAVDRPDDIEPKRYRLLEMRPAD